MVSNYFKILNGNYSFRFYKCTKNDNKFKNKRIDFFIRHDKFTVLYGYTSVL